MNVTFIDMETLKGSMQVINEYSYYKFIKTSRRTNAGFLLFIHTLKFSLLVLNISKTSCHFKNKND